MTRERGREREREREREGGKRELFIEDFIEEGNRAPVIEHRHMDNRHLSHIVSVLCDLGVACPWETEHP